MRTLIRYLLFTGAVVGLGWLSMTVKIGDRTAVAHVSGPIAKWWADWRKGEPEKAPVLKKARSKTRTAKKTRPPKRPEREIPPAELQSEPDAEKRVAMLADAARRARSKKKASKPAPTRITEDQKKALDALLSSGQSSR